jgi:antitoxin PrlF
MKARVVSRLTSKCQTTIPRAVREKLSLEPGDTVLYEIGPDGSVRLHKETPLDIGWLAALEATLDEWQSPEDAAAYDDL